MTPDGDITTTQGCRRENLVYKEIDLLYIPNFPVGIPAWSLSLNGGVIKRRFDCTIKCRVSSRSRTKNVPKPKVGWTEALHFYLLSMHPPSEAKRPYHQQIQTEECLGMQNTFSRKKQLVLRKFLSAQANNPIKRAITWMHCQSFWIQWAKPVYRFFAYNVIVSIEYVEQVPAGCHHLTLTKLGKKFFIFFRWLPI